MKVEGWKAFAVAKVCRCEISGLKTSGSRAARNHHKLNHLVLESLKFRSLSPLFVAGLICDLASQGVSARVDANAEQAEGPLPTLLPRRNADFASFPKGQESPRDIYPLP